MPCPAKTQGSCLALASCSWLSWFGNGVPGATLTAPSAVQSTMGNGRSFRGSAATIMPGGTSTFSAIAKTANVKQTWRQRRSDMAPELVTLRC